MVPMIDLMNHEFSIGTDWEVEEDSWVKTNKQTNKQTNETRLNNKIIELQNKPTMKLQNKKTQILL
jgi:hypothetical protein